MAFSTSRLIKFLFLAIFVVHFFISERAFFVKTVDFNGIRTGIFRVKDEQDEHHHGSIFDTVTWKTVCELKAGICSKRRRA